MKPTFANTQDPNQPYRERNTEGGEPPFSRDVSDEIVNPAPELPVEGFTVVESNLRSRTITNPPNMKDTRGSRWIPPGRR